ncbi:MAG: hypothetical protein LC130_24430 [Bryobacterales bacterium]|nr:hypothetical protein [Bryobacterales bacterium]
MIVFVSRSEANGRTLHRIAGQKGHSTVRVSDIEGAREQIGKLNPELVVCNTDLDGDQNWRELLGEDEIKGFALIVVLSLATEAPWVEVLGLGGFDVPATRWTYSVVVTVNVSRHRHCRPSSFARHAPTAIAAAGTAASVMRGNSCT